MFWSDRDAAAAYSAGRRSVRSEQNDRRIHNEIAARLGGGGDRTRALEHRVDQLCQLIAEKDDYIARLIKHARGVKADFARLDAWGDAILQDIAKLEATVASLQAELTASEAARRELVSKSDYRDMEHEFEVIALRSDLRDARQQLSELEKNDASGDVPTRMG